MVLIGAIIFSTSTSMVWQGIVSGTILEKKMKPRKYLIMNMWKSHGPARGHHLPNFINMV